MHVELEIFLFLSWCLHPSGVEKKPKSSTTSTGDLGIGLEQLQLMSKVKNIASLQLYGEEQASGSSQCQYE
ncbi:BnaA01g18250D [Brassica napus]|uniref:BnaA01g18250D protein n=1 Tax=Brassica napus TaxID=3708 RepID=A0A078GCW4_BRANA|nr:BnaA01g18250D [Brassica napus]